MWFKQISFYPVTQQDLPDAAQLAEKLAGAAFAPVQGLDWFSEGFAPPQFFSPELVFPTGKIYALALRKEEKVLPAAVINDVLVEKAADIREKEGREPGRRELKELKERIIDDLLPRAFTRSSHIQALWNMENGYLLINQAATPKAERFLSKLREALGGLEARLPDTVESPETLMTRWLRERAAQGGFELGASCELKGCGDDAPVIRVANEDLTADEIVEHVLLGKSVTQLELVWRNCVAFVLTHDFKLKRIRYLDMLAEEVNQYGDGIAAMLVGSQIVTAESLSALLDELVSLLGGWKPDV